MAVLLVYAMPFGALDNPQIPYKSTWGGGYPNYVYAESGNAPELANPKKPPLKASTSWYDEKSSPYEVANKEDMLGLSELVNSGNDFANKTIILTNDIIGLGADSENKFYPIGTAEHPFAGAFDGNNKTLSGLTITAPTSKNYIGLFGKTTKDSVIKNIDITGTLTVTEASKQIRYVGSVAGYAGGSIENCDSSMDITLTSSKQADKKNPGMIRAIGGIAGQAVGDITDCDFSGEINLNCSSNVSDEMGNIAGEVGGIVGIFGDESELKNPPTISNCNNTGDINFKLDGAGGEDRFGAKIYAHSQSVGGIAGYSMGSIDNCDNSGIIYTGVKSAKNMITTTDTIKEPVAGFGASAAGGIVGSLRGNSFDELSNADIATVGNPPYNYYTKNGGKKGGDSAQPATVKITDCTNTGIVIGLTGVGGIAGTSTGWSVIEGCANSGDIMGARWNKPFCGGIGGNVRSDILYCYNRGDIYSVTRAGYYCAGIAGGFVSDNTTATPENDRVTAPLMTGCYTTGRVYADENMRSGILVGENENLIRDNAFLPSLTDDGNIVDTNSGTVKDTVATSQFSVADLKSSKAIAHLNTYAAGKGLWEMIYVKDADGVNGGYPVLVRAGGDSAKMSLASATTLPGTPTAEGITAKYSAALDPVPTVAITGLYQNADFYVVPQIETAGQNVSNANYTGTVKGMGAFKDGNMSVTYKIIPAPISECVIQAEPQVFNWGIQRPTKEKINLYDEAGNPVEPSQYTVSDEYDAKKGTKAYDIGDGGRTVWAHYDYTNAHGRSYYYSVIVSAANGANYEGETTQMAWRIKSASMMPQRPKTDKMYDPLSAESVTYGKTYFDINRNGKIEASEKFDTLAGTDDHTGAKIQIPYTGGAIYPRVESATYKGKPLREAKNYDYFDRPLDFDYKYVYGNPNPEVDDGKNGTPINVSQAGKPETMTTRFTSGSNFENYNNVFYRIIPRNVSDSNFKLNASAFTYTGKNITPKFTLFGKNMDGSNYTITKIKANKAVGKATVTITGKNNLTGSKTFSFKILPTKVKLSSLKVGKKSLTVNWKKLSSKQGVKNYQIRYKVKGASKWKTKTVSAKLAKKSLTSLKKGKKYYVSIRAKKGAYYGAWSASKLSAKVK
jgi:hypothetical protein